MRRWFACLAVGLALGGSACGGSDSDRNRGSGFERVLAAVKGLTGEARERKLRALLRREGVELSFYTSMNIDQAEALVDAFEDEFDVDVGVYKAGGETIAPRLIEEARAGFRGADVVRINGLAMTNLADRGILAPYSSPHRHELVEGTNHPAWVADSFATFVLTWNRKLVGGRPPRAWEDLADPRFKGRVALEASDVSWYKALWEHWVATGKSRAEVDRLFERMARNALVVHGHTVLGQLMGAGEIAVAPNYRDTAGQQRAQGAPIDWEPLVEPVFPEGQGVGLVRHARHPAAAVLFHDWLLSDGQKILAREHADPTRKDLIPAPTAERRVIDFPSLAARQREWTERYDRLLRLGREAEAPD